ncbi:hypothetical protein N9K77_02145, partial [bacterium]|nr:hypothetical protein [bacterium]
QLALETHPSSSRSIYTINSYRAYSKESWFFGKCYKSLPLLEELMSYFRMTSKGEDVYYYYAKNQYCMGDYYLASDL